METLGNKLLAAFVFLMLITDIMSVAVGTLFGQEHILTV